MTDTLIDCREAFEKWILENSSVRKEEINLIERFPDTGHYRWQTTYAGWNAWKAAWEHRCSEMLLLSSDLHRDLMAALAKTNKNDSADTLARVCLTVVLPYLKREIGKCPIETAPKGIPVIVAGGIAMQKTGGEWFTGMEDPRYERPLQWPPKWWMPIPTDTEIEVQGGSNE